MSKKEGFPGTDFKELPKSHDQVNNVNFWLEDYSDIFSDFDHRSYLQRALSFDLLCELKRATREVKDGVKLNFYLHHKKRNKSNEKLIEERLVDHFSKHYHILRYERNKVIYTGLAFILFGVILMFGAAYLLHGDASTLFLAFLIILLEPGGWFLFWEGLDLVVFDADNLKPDLKFYKKMNDGFIFFHSYDKQ